MVLTGHPSTCGAAPSRQLGAHNDPRISSRLSSGRNLQGCRRGRVGRLTANSVKRKRFTPALAVRTRFVEPGGELWNRIIPPYENAYCRFVRVGTG